MRNKERLTEFNRANILSAAKRLFAEKGIIPTTVDDIAKEADYSKSTLYVYFKSKDEIYNCIVLEHMEILKQALAQALSESAGFPEGFFAICYALVKFHDDYPLYFESIVSELKVTKDDADGVLAQTYQVGEDINDLIADYFNRFLGKQITLNIPILQATFILSASLGGIITTANVKETYINRAMGITKETFMQNGFEFLLKSITYSGGIQS